MKNKKNLRVKLIQSICSCLMLIAPFISYAQDVITIQNGNSSQFIYLANDQNAISTAINQAIAGDTIILAGVTYNCTADITIDKPITLVGTGIHPDSALVAGAGGTRLNFIGSGNDLHITRDADNTALHGIDFQDGNAGLYVDVQSGVNNLNGLTIERCQIPYVSLGQGANTVNDAENVNIINCYINTIAHYGATNVHTYNSIIFTSEWADQTTEFTNCLFVNFNQSGSNTNLDVTYRNSIFLRSVTSAYTVNEPSRFYNNLWLMNSGGTLVQGANVLTFENSLEFDTGNLNEIFIEVPATVVEAFTEFEYTSDYHLNPGFFNYTLYSTGADDNGQIGIYGGIEAYQWKDGILPFNPHWVQLTVPSNSVNGVLEGITIKGSAQQN